MLTGKLPYDREGKPYVEIAKTIREVAPTPLRRIDRQFGRDIEVVLQTALAKLPSERYPSVAEFAGDLKRVALGQPVQATRTGPVRQAWMWGRRNPKSAGLAVSVAILLATSAVVSGMFISLANSRSSSLKASLNDLRHEQDKSTQLTTDLRSRNDELERANEQLIQSADTLQRTAMNTALLRVGSLVDSDPPMG